MGRRNDLTGQRFGRLVLLSPTDKRADKGSIVWKCRCDCGNLAEVSARRLVRGKVRSCGCLSHPTRKDYVGAHFGRLTVMGFAGTAKQLGKAGNANYWRCRCDCGRETLVNQTELQSGGIQSCGCLQKERTRECLELLEGTSVAILERNKKQIYKNNKSGYTGVAHAADGKWVAYISFKKKRYWLGRYVNKEDAINARRRGEELHDNFLKWYYMEYCRSGQAEEAESEIMEFSDEKGRNVKR